MASDDASQAGLTTGSVASSVVSTPNASPNDPHAGRGHPSAGATSISSAGHSTGPSPGLPPRPSLSASATIAAATAARGSPPLLEAGGGALAGAQQLPAARSVRARVDSAEANMLAAWANAPAAPSGASDQGGDDVGGGGGDTVKAPNPFATHQFTCITKPGAKPVLHSLRRATHPRYRSGPSSELVYTSEPVQVVGEG